MSKRTSKNPKNWHNIPVILCWHENNFESKKRQQISFRPARSHVPYRNHQACCERSSDLREAYTQTCPKWDNIFTTACRCRSMISCQVSWISDEFSIYWNFKTMYLNVRGRATVSRCLTFILISCKWPKLATKDTHLIFQPVFMHWSMCM
jgi:hypothetical protein